MAFAEKIPDMLAGLLAVNVAEVRAAAVYALGALVFNAESVREGSTLDSERSNLLRQEVCVLKSRRTVFSHSSGLTS